MEGFLSVKFYEIHVKAYFFESGGMLLNILCRY